MVSETAGCDSRAPAATMPKRLRARTQLFGSPRWVVQPRSEGGTFLGMSSFNPSAPDALKDPPSAFPPRPQLTRRKPHPSFIEAARIRIVWRLSRAPMLYNTRYSAGMTLTRLVLLVMAVMVVIIVARTVFGSRR